MKKRPKWQFEMEELYRILVTEKDPETQALIQKRIDKLNIKVLDAAKKLLQQQEELNVTKQP